MSIEALSKYTYEVRHNPNCPSPFQVVTCGDAGMIFGPRDMAHHRKLNIITYGKTLNEAVKAMLAEIEYRNRCQHIRVIEREHRGLVWA